MKQLSLLAILVILAGCASQTSAPKADEHAGHATAAPKGTAAKGEALGSKVQADHFDAVLSTEPATPKVGETKFVVQLGHHGEPATDAKVHVQLSMPGMDMGGPGVEMKHVSGGRYEGTTKLPMAGEYQADVHLPGGATAVFKFEASE